MEIQNDYNFSDLYEAVWGNAEDLLKKVNEFGYEDEFMAWLEESFSAYEDVPTLTEVNDYLSYDEDGEKWLEELVGGDSPDDYNKIIDFCKAFYKPYSLIQSEDEEDVETFLVNHFATISDAVDAMEGYSINDWEDFKADYE